jgi:Domain of unknown function (DUF4893)
MRLQSVVLIGALVLAAAVPAFAGWQTDVSAFDRQRLAHLEESRAKGLAEAEAGGNASDLAIIHGALAGGRGDVSQAELMGTWRCRQMKLGGISPSIVYGWFRCRVRQSGHGLYFEKISGSQRVSGYLDRYDGGGWVLLGALTVNNERQRPYSGGSEGAGTQVTSNDAIGLITKAGPGHLRIEFPYPALESHFDVMELRR